MCQRSSGSWSPGIGTLSYSQSLHYHPKGLPEVEQEMETCLAAAVMQPGAPVPGIWLHSSELTWKVWGSC